MVHLFHFRWNFLFIYFFKFRLQHTSKFDKRNRKAEYWYIEGGELLHEGGGHLDYSLPANSMAEAQTDLRAGG